MASNALRKGLVYFGLADDGQAELEATGTDGYQSAPREYQAAPQPMVVTRESYAGEAAPSAVVRPIQTAPGFSGSVANQSAPQADLRRITTIHPRSYNDARLIGEAFRGGTPVIMNLSDMSDDDARRLVDFSSGLIFGMYGGIERVTPKVWLLSPEHIEVVGKEDIEAAEPTGGQFYNQS